MRSGLCGRWICSRSTARSIEFDVYVGTSAGAFVASAVANGVTPEEMMRVIVQQVPTPFPDARVSSLLRPNYAEFVTKGLLLPLRLVSAGAHPDPRPRPGLGGRHRRRAGRGAAVGAVLGRWDRALRAHDPVRSRPNRRLPSAAERAVSRRHRPRHLRANRVRRRGLGRRADLHSGQRVDRAADDVQAGQGQGPRADRRRHPVDDQPRHRG